MGHASEKIIYPTVEIAGWTADCVNCSMKTIIYLMILLPAIAIGQEKYDAVLAKSLGGNDSGMKSYVMAILKTGPNTTATDAEKKELFAGHMANIRRLADEGKLVVAGPFGKNDLTYRGIFILNCENVEEAKSLTETDPAVVAGIFACDYLPWYGTAALMATPGIHEKIVKAKP